MTSKIKGVFEKRPGSGVWWIRYKDQHAREHREKVGSKKLAAKVYAKRVTEIAERRFFPEREIRRHDVLLGSLLAEYFRDHVAGRLKNEKHEARYARYWEESRRRVVRLAMSSAVRLRSGRVPNSVGFASSRCARTAWFSTLRRYSNSRLMVAGATSLGAGGLKLFKLNNARIRFLTDEEEARLHEALDAEYWPLVVFALHTGLRQADQFTLPWTDVNFDAGTITVRNPKGGTTYHVPMSATVRALLRSLPSRLSSLPSRLKSTYVFPSPTGTPLNARNFRRVWMAALSRASIADFRWHDLRHTFASRLVMKGVPLATVQKLMGHASIRMTERYAHLAPDHVAAAVLVLDAPSGTRSGTSTGSLGTPARATSSN